MLDRHCARLIDSKQNQLVIGQHPTQSLNHATSSPLLKRDFKAVEEYLKSGKEQGDEAKIEQILKAPRGLDLDTLGLTMDTNGLLVLKFEIPC
jgi:hypothetical protein